MVEHLPDMHRTLSSILGTAQTRKELCYRPGVRDLVSPDNLDDHRMAFTKNT